MLKDIFSHPLTRDLPLDDPRLIPLRLKIVQDKGFLKNIYIQWYRLVLRHLPKSPFPVIELGTGPGFLQELLPGLITSDLIACRNVNVVVNAEDLPFPTASLGSIVMFDVLHHIQDPRSFFLSATRCVEVGGRILMSVCVESINLWGKRYIF